MKLHELLETALNDYDRWAGNLVEWPIAPAYEFKMPAFIEDNKSSQVDLECHLQTIMQTLNRISIGDVGAAHYCLTGQYIKTPLSFKVTDFNTDPKQWRIDMSIILTRLKELHI